MEDFKKGDHIIDHRGRKALLVKEVEHGSLIVFQWKSENHTKCIGTKDRFELDKQYYREERLKELLDEDD